MCPPNIPKIILGSASLWRRFIFKKEFPEWFISEQETFISVDIDEKAIRHKDPKIMVQLIANAKCDKILEDLGSKLKARGPCVLITADQVFFYSDELLHFFLLHKL